VSGAARWI